MSYMTERLDGWEAYERGKQWDLKWSYNFKIGWSRARNYQRLQEGKVGPIEIKSLKVGLENHG